MLLLKRYHPGPDGAGDARAGTNLASGRKILAKAKVRDLLTKWSIRLTYALIVAF